MGTLDGVQFEATYCPVAVVSCIFFLWVFRYVSPSLSAKICPSFKKLSEAKQIDWHSRVNSSLHATIVSCMCVYALLYEEELEEEPIWDDNPVVRSSCAIVVGYMAADAMLMTIYYKQIGEKFYFFHHAATVYAYYHVMTIGILPYFANYRLIAELSTPLVNNRWFMDTLGFDKAGPAYMANGAAMTAMFFACRILCMPQYWYKVYSVYGTEKFHRLGNLQYVLIYSCFVLDVINLFWFYKLCKGIHKMFARKRTVDTSGTTNLAIKKEG